jgi:outer membrane lipoprotein-sorting protein
MGLSEGAERMTSRFRGSIGSVLVIPVLLLLGACGTAVSPSRSEDLSTFIQDVEKKAQLVNQFRAVFVKTRKTPVFQKKLTVTGHLVFQKPGRFDLTMNGDINVEILSDGKSVTLVHDKKDEEFFQVRGDRDLTRFEDPLMLLINCIGNGGLRQFNVLESVPVGDSLRVEIAPGNDRRFDRIRKVSLWFAQSGEIERVKILFKNGGEDETVFRSWALLAKEDPEILRLNRKLSRVSEVARARKETAVNDEGNRSLAKNTPFPEQIGRSAKTEAVSANCRP